MSDEELQAFMAAAVKNPPGAWRQRPITPESVAKMLVEAFKARGLVVMPRPTGYQAKWTVGYPLRYGGISDLQPETD